MNKRILLSLPVLSLSLLQACGGGGSGDDDANPAAFGQQAAATGQPAANTGSVSARFLSNENTRYLLLSPRMQSLGRGTPSEQADSGAMVRMGSKSLSGSHQTVDIAGNAHFALGRWLKGTLTSSSETYALDGKDHESYHYIVYNSLTELPTEGRLQCTTVAATAPTALSDTHEKLGAASGSTSVSFDNSGAAIQGSVQVRVGAQSAAVDLSRSITEVHQVAVKGLMFANGAGAAMTLTDQGTGIPGLVVGYRAQLPGGTLYNGVARFECTRA